MTSIELLDCDEKLQPWIAEWHHLKGNSPMQSPAWMLNWWQSFRQADDTLHILAITNGDQLLGLAPWYCRNNFVSGQTLRFLGDGRVCSDFQSILCRPGFENEVIESIVEALSQHRFSPWELMDLEGVSSDDWLMNRFLESMQTLGHTTHQRLTLNTWRLPLGGSWSAAYARLSKTQQSQMRNLLNRFSKEGYQLRMVSQHLSEVSHFTDELIRLHQLRWQACNESGCFANVSFREFFQKAMRDMILLGTAEIALLELDGRVLAAHCWLVQDNIGYGYQTGRDPEFDEQRVGRIMHAVCLRWVAEQGYRAFDFLRGDEQYKQQFRAEPTECRRVRIVDRAMLPQLRHSLWATCREVKALVTGFGLPTPTPASTQ